MLCTDSHVTTVDPASESPVPVPVLHATTVNKAGANKGCLERLRILTRDDTVQRRPLCKSPDPLGERQRD